uniref:Uncharacterized protein n=1 Tax=Vitis vinifera TaxID=29760 RepID=F6HH31_VITVI
MEIDQETPKKQLKIGQGIITSEPC